MNELIIAATFILLIIYSMVYAIIEYRKDDKE